MKIICALILILLIGLNSLYDWYMINRARKKGETHIFHPSRFLIRFVVIAFNASLFVEFNPDRSWEVTKLMLLQAAIFWIVFDYLLNVMRGLPIDYVGETANADTIFQRFSNPFLVQISVKLFALTGSIFWVIW